MLFNSVEFLFMFLPIVVGIFVWLNKRQSGQAAVLFLAMASLFFYAWWDTRYLILLGLSICWNWWCGTRMMESKSRRMLAMSIGVNLVALGYYKYANFFVSAVAQASGAEMTMQQVVLPLGISFFTFTQIAFLVDAYRGEVREKGFLNYVLFVTFFPHLIAGPVLHHKEMMPQFAALQGKSPRDDQVARGLFLLIVGLFKKVVIADSLAKYVDPAFGNVASLEIMDAWTATVAYTLQLYFDFSAYSEMAMGIALLFGIELPKNFNSPYKASSVADFWKRWHMTLSRFLRDYLYIPLGGNRHGFGRTLAALMATMVLGGLWHGAGWQFIVWGAMHGAMLVTHRVWVRAGGSMPEWLGRSLTMFGVMLAWVMFRASTLSDGWLIWRKMFGFEGVVLPAIFRDAGLKGVQVSLSPMINGVELPILIVVLGLCMSQKNVHEIWSGWEKPKKRQVMGLTALAVCSMFAINTVSSFAYWNF